MYESWLKAIDIPVALRLAQVPEEKYAQLSEDLGVSSSTTHGSVARLQAAGLLRPESRTVNWLNLREFIEHGLRYAFPAVPGKSVRGVPTAHASPPLKDHILSSDVVVWPDAHGPAEGKAVVPLFPQSKELPSRCPELYEAVALADALRIGRVRERKLALAELDARLGNRSAA